MRKLTNSFKKIFCCALVLLSIASIPCSFAGVGNIEDWYWCKSIGTGDEYKTAVREKLDDTSVYINYQGGTKDPIRVRVYGTNTTNNYGNNMTLKNMYNNYNTYYDVYVGTERGMQNLVHENGAKKAYLRITVGNGYLASGVWSPDSVGNYT